jgi:hypothetical protein
MPRHATYAKHLRSHLQQGPSGVNGGKHLYNTLQHTNGLCALVMSADMFLTRMGRRGGGKRGRPGGRASVGGRGRVHDI